MPAVRQTILHVKVSKLSPGGEPLAHVCMHDDAAEANHCRAHFTERGVIVSKDIVFHGNISLHMSNIFDDLVLAAVRCAATLK